MAERSTRLMKILLLVLAGIYLLNCLSPIRLHVDTLRYFAIKDCLEFGCPPDSEAAKDYFPYGYTALLIILSKLHLLHSFVLILINIFFLFTGLLLMKKLFGQVLPAVVPLLLILLNWTMIKFVTHPLSEMQYIFFSMASLYFFNRYAGSRRTGHLLAAFLCGGLAFLTRSVGISLIIALMTGLVGLYRQELLQLIRRNRILVILLVLVAVGVVVFSRVLGLDHYTEVFSKQFKKGTTFSAMIKWHFTEWSEVGFNTSIVKLTPFVTLGKAKLIYLVTGILLVGGFGWLVYLRRKVIPFIVIAYLLYYTLLMFDWPFYDPRFWVPILPLIVAVICCGPFPRARLPKLFVYLACGVYVVLGVVSVGYMTYTSLDKKVMVRTQANGVYRNEYETVFFGKPLSDTAQHIDPAVLSVIQRYN